MVKKLPFEEFVKIYERVPRVCVELVVKTDQGILFNLRDISPWKDLWHIPGGTVLLTETISEAIQRVSTEEIGVSVKIKKLLGYSEFMEDMGPGYKHAVTLVFLVEPESLNLKLNEQSREYKFFTQIPDNTVKEHIALINKHYSEIFG